MKRLLVIALAWFAAPRVAEADTTYYFACLYSPKHYEYFTTTVFSAPWGYKSDEEYRIKFLHELDRLGKIPPVGDRAKSMGGFCVSDKDPAKVEAMRDSELRDRTRINQPSWKIVVVPFDPASAGAAVPRPTSPQLKPASVDPIREARAEVAAQRRDALKKRATVDAAEARLRRDAARDPGKMCPSPETHNTMSWSGLDGNEVRQWLISYTSRRCDGRPAKTSNLRCKGAAGAPQYCTIDYSCPAGLRPCPTATKQ